MSGPVRVLVVDDSALMRKLIPQILESDGSIKVVGTAMDGAFGLRKIEELKPHVVTLDLEMPRMDGIAMLREITRRYRLPVIVFSAHSREGAHATLKALALGAFDFVTKPDNAASGHLQEIARELALKIKTAAISGSPKMMPEIPPVRFKGTACKNQSHHPPTRVVAIGVSTGGPNALEYMLSKIPLDFGGCFLVAQHMPEGFTEMLAKRLDESSMIHVREARSGELLGRRTSADLPRQPPFVGPSLQNGSHSCCFRFSASQRPSTIGGCVVPFRREGIWRSVDRFVDDRDGGRRRRSHSRSERRRWIDTRSGFEFLCC